MVRDRLVPGNLGSILLYVISFHEQDRMNGVVKEPARQDNERWCVCVTVQNWDQQSSVCAGAPRISSCLQKLHLLDADMIKK